MENHNLKLCRLCLKVIRDQNFQVIGEITREILDVLMIKLNLYISAEPLKCKNCALLLEKCFEFKSTCLSIEDSIVPYAQNNSNVSLQEIYIKQKGSRMNISKDQEICRLCMQLILTPGCISLDETNKDIVLVKDVIQNYIPEIDLATTKDPVICEACHTCLHDYYVLVSKCLDVENKISHFCKCSGTDDKGQVLLPKVLQCTGENMNNFDISDYTLSIMKDAEDGFVFTNKVPHEVQINNENELEVENNCMEAIKQIYSKSKGIVMDENNQKSVPLDQSQSANLKSGDHVGGKNYTESDQNSEISPTTFKSQNDIIAFEVTQKEVNEESYIGCDMSDKNCEVTHRNTEDTEEYKCDICPFKTKRKHNLKRHILKDHPQRKIITYNCQICSYKTRRRDIFKKHRLFHKDELEAAVYKCELCSYRSQQKNQLTQHKLTHNSREILHKCTVCAFMASDTEHLNRHLLTHNIEETLYNCGLCSYKAKNKDHLSKHLLLHEDVPGVKAYQCGTCSYKTNYKSFLDRHVLSHKSPSEVLTYKCNMCLYGAKRKDHLRRHILTHKSEPEEAIYKCEECLYKAKHKDHLRKHMLLHKSLAEVTVYNCDSCSYSTKRKDHIKIHILVHKSSTEVTLYECEMCSHKTKRKDNLKRHLLTHKVAK